MAFYDQSFSSKEATFLASFRNDPRSDFGVFATGYARSAKRLADLLEGRDRFPDYEAYPVVFLYRHAFELSLKSVIYASWKLSSYKGIVDFEQALLNHHDVSKLAAKASQVLKILFPNDESLKEFSQRFESVACDLSEIDSQSFSFRYPVDKSGGYLTRKNLRVNLTAFRTEMDYILEGFSVVDFGFDVELSKAREVFDVLAHPNWLNP